MSVTLTRFEKEPLFDRLPVHMLRCGRDVPPNDRIYAQAQLCRTARAVYVRIWTFESAPAPETRLEAIFTAQGHTLTAAATLGGETSLAVDGTALGDRLTAWLFSGEDLQGVYAGAVLAIDSDAFFGALGQTPDEKGGEIGVNLLRRGNFVSSLAPEGVFLPLGC